MKAITWTLGAAALAVALALVLIRPIPILLDPGLPYAGLAARASYILILATVLCLHRVLVGPTAADRIVAIDIFGILIVGFAAILSVATQRSWYVDIGIAWALQSFIGTLALSKYLEGRAFDA